VKAVLLVPWRSTPAREPIWQEVRGHLADLHLPIFTGDSHPGRPFNRSEARNVAAERAGDWDVALFVDADTYVPLEQADFALEMAATHHSLVYPYTRFVSMNPITGEARERTSAGFPHSGNVALSADAYSDLGGWDERISGWGYEDGALAVLARQVFGSEQCVMGTVASIEHTRTVDETPEVVIARARPAFLEGYASDPAATVAAVRQARLNRWASAG
jgi:hypothetical protein